MVISGYLWLSVRTTDLPCRARLAVEESSWLTVDTWECTQDTWTRSAVVLQRFADDLRSHSVTIHDTGDKAGPIKVANIALV